MASTWKEPIFDRTSYDVAFALQQISTWKNSHSPVSTVYDLKGCLNLSDLNRIEEDIKYLGERLIAYRYPIVVNCKEWVRSDLPTIVDMQRIASNIRLLFTGFATPSEYSPVPDVMLSYNDINAIERNLYLLKQMIDAMQGSFIISGTYKSGATNRLPLRR